MSDVLAQIKNTKLEIEAIEEQISELQSVIKKAEKHVAHLTVKYINEIYCQHFDTIAKDIDSSEMICTRATQCDAINDEDGDICHYITISLINTQCNDKVYIQINVNNYDGVNPMFTTIADPSNYEYTTKLKKRGREKRSKDKVEEYTPDVKASEYDVKLWANIVRDLIKNELCDDFGESDEDSAESS